VAALLNLALSGTYMLLREGEIPARKLGSRWVIPKQAFHEWLDSTGAPTEPTSEQAQRFR
jgi:excisionase family DNA binding protein